MISPTDIDLGTPLRVSAEAIALEIDGRPVTVPEGTSVMRAAAQVGVMVPKLCATESLEAFGSCRLCLVEIEGHAGYPASCTTPVAAGMKVRTQSPRLQALRRGVMELYLSDHPSDCVSGAGHVDCELHEAARQLGVQASRFGLEGASHVAEAKDESNPYFTYDPAQCIVCSRCVRVCEEIQGSFALTVDGRGFASRIVAGAREPFMASECVSCGACVQACPTDALLERTVIECGAPERSVVTTCAYCGVGCGLVAELKGDRVVRMTPWKGGQANEGHACVKGRFAWGYATHPDRVTRPMIRRSTSDPWTEVSWDEAIGHAAAEFRRIQAAYGKEAVGGITSSRCTNEETYLVQKLVRAAFGNNNVDTCARVCHAPTGYALGQAFGTSAGTQSFRSVDQVDVFMVIGANPTEAHPVLASRIKRRLRQGAKLIVLDPRRIDLVAGPHVAAQHHLQLRPGTNVAVVTALAHVIVTEGLLNEAFIATHCDAQSFTQWREFAGRPENSPEATQALTQVPADEVRAAARLYATGGNAAIYYGLGVTEHAQGSTMVLGIANLAMATGNIGREGVGVNPLRGQNNVQGSCDMGSFPHELPGYRHVSDAAVRAQFEAAWGVALSPEPGLRIPHIFDAALEGSFKGLYCQGEDLAQSDPDSRHVAQALAAMECVVVQDLFLNETAKFAHVFLPGASFLEKDGTFTNAERRISRVRRVIDPLAGHADWEVTQMLANALGLSMHYAHPSQVMDEIAALTPSFAGVSYEKLDRLGSVQWPCHEGTGEAGTQTLHVDGFVRGKGRFFITQPVASDERVTYRFPLLLTTGRVLTQYNVGTQTRRTANLQWLAEDLLEIHPLDAEERDIIDGDWAYVESRVGATRLRAAVTERVPPGVVYASFHFPSSGTNLVTTDSADWATDCPEFKVTAVQVSAAAKR